MNTTLDFTVSLTTINCGKCAGTYAINEKYRAEKQQESGFWHCPYCETSWGYGEGTNAKLVKQIAQLQTTIEHKDAALISVREQRDTAERRRRAMKGVHTRVCNRIKHGVCVCCNRTFANLAAHMKTQHPAFKAEEPKA